MTFSASTFHPLRFLSLTALLVNGGTLARAASAADPAPAHPGATPFAVAAYLLGVLCIFLLAVVVWLLGHPAARRGLNRFPATPDATPPAAPAAAPLAAAAPETPENDEAFAAIEAGKQAIQGLLRRLAECVSELVESHADYDDRMESHRVAIQKTMTLAGLEEIERLIVAEIEEMRRSGQQYRAQLSQAHTRIQEQNEALARIQADARLDHLTRLPNRRAFDSRFGEEFERSRRYGSPLSMLMLDIDHFKTINDTYGHPVGDRMLQLVAMLVQKNLRKSDFAARYGGEEFAVLLPETAVRPARLAAEKLRRVIEESALMHERSTIRVTVSIGVGDLETGRDGMDKFIERIDAALYRAKQNGRNRVELIESPPTDPGL